MPDDKKRDSRDEQNTKITDGLEYWDEARRTDSMRFFEKGTKGDPFELVKDKETLRKKKD